MPVKRKSINHPHPVKVLPRSNYSHECEIDSWEMDSSHECEIDSWSSRECNIEAPGVDRCEGGFESLFDAVKHLAEKHHNQPWGVFAADKKKVFKRLRSLYRQRSWWSYQTVDDLMNDLRQFRNTDIFAISIEEDLVWVKWSFRPRHVLKEKEHAKLSEVLTSSSLRDQIITLFYLHTKLSAQEITRLSLDDISISSFAEPPEVYVWFESERASWVNLNGRFLRYSVSEQLRNLLDRYLCSRGLSVDEEPLFVDEARNRLGPVTINKILGCFSLAMKLPKWRSLSRCSIDPKSRNSGKPLEVGDDFDKKKAEMQSLVGNASSSSQLCGSVILPDGTETTLEEAVAVALGEPSHQAVEADEMQCSNHVRRQINFICSEKVATILEEVKGEYQIGKFINEAIEAYQEFRQKNQSQLSGLLASIETEQSGRKILTMLRAYVREHGIS